MIVRPKVFIALSILILAILLNHNILRAVKDGFIVTLIGAEAISFIKLWIELPVGVLFVLIYTRLCNSFSTETLFRSLVAIFILIHLGFAFYIFPNLSLLLPNHTKITAYLASYPNLYWFIVIYSKWPLILFYIIAELWPVIIYSLLFWQLVNNITSMQEAPVLYPRLNLLSQLNLLISGPLITYFAHFSDDLPITDPALLLKTLAWVSLSLGMIIMFVQYCLEKKLVVNKKQVAKSLLSTRDSIKIILTSRYLGKICLLIVAYHTCMTLVEGIWLYEVRKFSPNLEQFMHYQGKILFYTGCLAICFSLINSNLLLRYGWRFTALINPITLLGAGSLFLLALIWQVHISYYSLAMIVTIGAIQNIISKSIKYSFFDTTKEMLYLPLTGELRNKGKAAVDIIGVKAGKILGALPQFCYFTLLPTDSYENLSLILFGFYLISCMIWIASVKSLASDYQRLAVAYSLSE